MDASKQFRNAAVGDRCTGPSPSSVQRNAPSIPPPSVSNVVNDQVEQHFNESLRLAVPSGQKVSVLFNVRFVPDINNNNTYFFYMTSLKVRN